MDAAEGRVASLTRWHLACAGIQIACLGLDHVAGPFVFSRGIGIRLGLVVPLYLAAAWLLSRGPHVWRKGMILAATLAPIVVSTGAVAWLGLLSLPPFSDRYFMAAGMIPLLGIILMPLTFREGLLLGMLAVPVYAATGLGAFGIRPAEQVADLVAFMSGLIGIGLLVRYRLARIERANLDLRRREHERTEHLATLAHELAVLSNTDPLTGVANRRGFDLAAARVCRECVVENRWLGLLMIDVDHFKSFNDLAGHVAGDACLRGLVTAMLAACRLEDVMARFGGEEFVVLLPGLSPDQTELCAERLRLAAAAAGIPHPGRGRSPVTVSIGAAAIRPSALDGIDELVTLADVALYAAKAAGRNRSALWAASDLDEPARTIALTAAAQGGDLSMAEHGQDRLGALMTECSSLPNGDRTARPT